MVSSVQGFSPSLLLMLVAGHTLLWGPCHVLSGILGLCLRDACNSSHPVVTTQSNQTWLPTWPDIPLAEIPGLNPPMVNASATLVLSVLNFVLLKRAFIFHLGHIYFRLLKIND